MEPAISSAKPGGIEEVELDRKRLRYWLALSRLKGIDCVGLKPLLDLYGEAEVLFEAVLGEDFDGVPPKAIRAVKEFNDWQWTSDELDRAEGLGVRIVSYADEQYPSLLREIPDPPVLLYVAGMTSNVEAPTVAIVGTRRPSHYGRAMAEKLAAGLAERGIAVVSGMARGCDSAAHKGSLGSGGFTLAVLGTGVDRVYPGENKKLYDEICEKGMVISEYPLGTPPVATNFPRRNRIISGLSLGVIVVEAPMRSGSLMTARLALEYNRDIFALPGPVTSTKSSGTNKLIRDGAMLIESADDILEGLGLERLSVEGTAERSNDDTQDKKTDGAGKRGVAAPALVGDEKLVWRALEDGPVHIDFITERTGLSAAGASATLLSMELKGLIEQLPGKCFTKRIF